MDNADWNKKLLLWNYHDIVFKDYPGWDKINNNEISFVMFEITNNKDKSSRDIAIEFDDISNGYFYYRDWTMDGIPFVNEDEIYWSGFWFQYFKDAKKFQDMFGGMGNWMDGYEEFEKKCNNKRNNRS